jgi:hypothetical protein
VLALPGLIPDVKDGGAEFDLIPRSRTVPPPHRATFAAHGACDE